jgi:excisionase family DNA binding protein
MQDSTPTTARLLRPAAAAEYLAISERKLWQLTATSRIPAIRIDRSVRYDMADLDRFILVAKGVVCP